MSWLKSFFGTDNTTTTSSNAESPVDIIVYAASLASNPKTIDPILDGLREVTSHLKPNASLSKDDQVILAAVYNKLELYLTSKDPLRAFTKQQLQQKIQDKFGGSTTAYSTFWTNSGLADKTKSQ